MGTIFVFLIVFVPAMVVAMTDQPENKTLCPPFQARTVYVTCHLDGAPVNCTGQPSVPGTVAHFSCKQLHEFLFGYLPASGYLSRCGDDGSWTVRPFICVPSENLLNFSSTTIVVQRTIELA
ncbi:uncharacterized protein LOC117649628 [Thrips palmi]|uniref:Uncharacterized protein LOC117649628 n=1 Tax=Thrips palmi TaxID=161013 RepID=A0A6P8ZT56_THRPL|nr:uncharacterized protein LOC117649628 [Thrips palmi]